MQRITKLPDVERKDGLRLEGIVRRWLEDRYPIVEDSLPHENIQQDIDFHVCNNEGKWVSISVKVNSPEYYTEPFLFELKQAWYKTDDNAQLLLDEDPVVVNAWYYNGRAKYYLVWKRRTLKAGKLWLIDKAQLVEYVNANKFDKVTRQKEDVQRREVLEGKAWTELGLIAQDKLIKAGIAKLVGEIKQ